jgi:hypothetical protein
LGGRRHRFHGRGLGEVARRGAPAAAFWLAWGWGLLAGGAAARAEPVPIDVVMEGPVAAELRLAIAPPLDPRGRRWHVAVASRAAAGAGDSWEGLADENGYWSQAGLAPGRPYHLSIGTPVSHPWWPGLQLEEIWTERTVTVAVGAPRQPIAIPIVEVEGRVSRGAEPVASLIDFWGPHGESLALASGEDGRFHGSLPELDGWNVRVRPSIMGPVLSLEEVAVRPPPGERIARLDFEIPDTELTVEMVDADGKPAQGALASVFPADTTLGQRRALASADAAGKALIRGLQPGTYWAYAEKGNAWGLAEVRPGAGNHLRLQLRPLVKLRGQVTSAQGPVAGAAIHAVGNPALPDDSNGGTVALAAAEAGGGFELELAPEARFAQLLVMARGFGLRWLQVPLVSPPALSIELPGRGDGTLVLKLPPALLREVRFLRQSDTWLGRAGGYVRIQELDSWELMQPEPRARRADGAMVLPDVESGAYSLCTGAGAKAALLAGQPPPPAACVTGTLPPGGELVLDAGSIPAGLAADWQ